METGLILRRLKSLPDRELDGLLEECLAHPNPPPPRNGRCAVSFLVSGQQVDRLFQQSRQAGEDRGLRRPANRDHRRHQPSRLLVPAESQAIFASGKLLYVQSGNLLARSFDPDKLEFTGDPVTVAKNIVTMENAFRGPFSASENGHLIYITGQSRDCSLAWLDRSGRVIEVVSGIRSTSNAVELAPDLHRIAVVDQSGRTTESISIVDLARGVAARFTPEARMSENPLSCKVPRQ